MLVKFGVDQNDKKQIEWFEAEAYIRAKADVYGVNLSQEMLYGEFRNPWEVAQEIYTAQAMGTLMAKSNPYFQKGAVVPETYGNKISNQSANVLGVQNDLTNLQKLADQAATNVKSQGNAVFTQK